MIHIFEKLTQNGTISENVSARFYESDLTYLITSIFFSPQCHLLVPSYIQIDRFIIKPYNNIGHAWNNII